MEEKEIYQLLLELEPRIVAYNENKNVNLTLNDFQILETLHNEFKLSKKPFNKGCWDCVTNVLEVATSVLGRLKNENF